MKGYINNKLGEIQIGPDVIAMYAGTTAAVSYTHLDVYKRQAFRWAVIRTWWIRR